MEAYNAFSVALCQYACFKDIFILYHRIRVAFGTNQEEQNTLFSKDLYGILQKKV